MVYDIDAIITYMTCPRRYQFKYVDREPHTLTYYEVFCISHAAAIDDYWQTLRDGETPTAERYAGRWQSEFAKLSPMIGAWGNVRRSLIGTRAVAMAREFIRRCSLPAPRPRSETYRTSLDMGGARKVSITPDFSYDNAHGVYVFGIKPIGARIIRRHPKVITAYTVDSSHQVVTIGISYFMPCAFSNIHLSTPAKATKHIVIAAILDTIRAIRRRVFPRCNPSLVHCSPLFCGYWKRCTNTCSSAGNMTMSGGR